MFFFNFWSTEGKGFVRKSPKQKIRTSLEPNNIKSMYGSKCLSSFLLFGCTYYSR